MAVERTLSIIKPDAVAKNVIGQILARFLQVGFARVEGELGQRHPGRVHLRRRLRHRHQRQQNILAGSITGLRDRFDTTLPRCFVDDLTRLIIGAELRTAPAAAFAATARARAAAR